MSSKKETPLVFVGRFVVGECDTTHPKDHAQPKTGIVVRSSLDTFTFPNREAVIRKSDELQKLASVQEYIAQILVTTGISPDQLFLQILWGTSEEIGPIVNEDRETTQKECVPATILKTALAQQQNPAK